MNTSVKILCGDAVQVLRTLPAQSVHTCITSPPYWALRDYGVDGQIGLEPTVPEFVAKMVDVFREVHRVLRDDGTCWVNLGDTYSPDKNLVGIPWRVAFALQDAGWLLRQDIVWHKTNPMPESVRDRCTKAHEYIFLLSKRPRYHFDFAAMQEPVSGTAHARGHGVNPKAKVEKAFGTNSRIRVDRDPAHQTEGRVRHKQNRSFSAAIKGLVAMRNKRSVWSLANQPYKGAHFATFPANLIRPCVRAGCPAGGIVLDPFAGSGTTGMVALQEGRSAILVELNPAYIPLINERLAPYREEANAG